MTHPYHGNKIWDYRIKEFYQKEWVKEMESHKQDGKFKLLPSEAAKIVGDRWSVSPETVLLAFLP